MSATSRYFGYRLLDRRVARVTNFFDLDDAVPLRGGLSAMRSELERLKGAATFATAESLFAELVRPRETLFRFDLPRALITENLEASLNDLFVRYVEPDVATKVQQEHVMEKALRQLLAQAQLAQLYTAKELGEGQFQVKFPFVRAGLDRIKIIKPLHLDHVEPVKAIEHGLLWAAKVSQLKKRNLFQGEILFTLQGGLSGALHLRAKDEVESMLRDVNAEVVDQASEDEILAFAGAA